MVFLWLLLVVLGIIALTVRLRVHAFLALRTVAGYPSMAFFWVVAKLSGMDTNLALKTHTLSTVFLGITGIITIYMLNLVLHSTMR